MSESIEADAHGPGCTRRAAMAEISSIHRISVPPNRTCAASHTQLPAAVKETSRVLWLTDFELQCCGLTV